LLRWRTPPAGDPGAGRTGRGHRHELAEPFKLKLPTVVEAPQSAATGGLVTQDGRRMEAVPARGGTAQGGGRPGSTLSRELGGAHGSTQRLSAGTEDEEEKHAVKSKPVVTLSMPSDREVVITAVLDARRSRLRGNHQAGTREALVGPETHDGDLCEIDLRPGGAWRYVIRDNERARRRILRCLREITAPERLVYTEGWRECRTTIIW